jgi:cytochrome b6-f complex iron-sulfur subunit
MDRKEFLRKSVMLTLGAAAGSAFLEACSKQSSTPGSTAPTVDFTIDISSSQYNALQTNGGYLYSNNIIIARDSKGNFVALYSVCTHAGCTIGFDGTSQFPCPCHGSIFSESGSVVRGPAATAEKKYNTTLTGNMLRIYG